LSDACPCARNDPTSANLMGRRWTILKGGNRGVNRGGSGTGLIYGDLSGRDAERDDDSDAGAEGLDGDRALERDVGAVADACLLLTGVIEVRCAARGHGRSRRH
jgi:hypothetical protein